MLGEKIAEERGKITGTRILQGDDYRYLKMAMSFRAAVAYQAGQGKLERLNPVMGMVEFEVDENGNTHAILHEWK